MSKSTGEKKSKKAAKKRQPVPRKTHRFQLRQNDEVDLQLQEILDYKRTKRQSTTVIREGVFLWWALENGNIEYLLEKFPQYRPMFSPDNTAVMQQFMEMLKAGQSVSVNVGAPALQQPVRREIQPRMEALPIADSDESMNGFMDSMI